MGFIDDFKLKLENFANGSVDRQGKTGDGQIDRYEKASLFNNPELLNELKTKCEEDQTVQQQVLSDLGMSLSFIKTRIDELTGAGGQRRAPGVGGEGEDGDGNGTEGNGNGATINIIFNNNWYINITIQNDTREMIEELIKAFTENMQTITNDLFNKFAAYLNNEGDKFKEFLVGLFQKLYDGNGTSVDVLQGILAQLQSMGLNIENMDKAIQDLLKVQMNMLKTENYNAENIDKLVALVTENNEETKNQNKILGLIYDALINLSNDQKEYFNKILANMENNKASYDQMVALLQAIKEENSENSTKLLKLVAENNDLSKEILNALTKIGAMVGKYGEEYRDLLTKILNKELVVNIDDITVNIDIDAILAKLDDMMKTLQSIDKNTGDTADYSKKILEAISKLGLSITTSLDTIINAMGNDTGKLDKLIELLGKLDAHNTEQNQAILEAIAGLGDGISGIIDALNNLNIDVEVDLNPVIDAIKTCGSNIITKLEKLFSTLSAVNDNVIAGNTNNEKFVNYILNAIKNVKPGDSIDLDKIMTILGQILDAIKDHSVTVKVIIDKDGNIHCGTNEGENNDWTNVLNARAVSPLENWGEDDATGISSAKTDSKNGPIYDLSGRKVTGDLISGQIYIQNGKKFVAQ